MKPILVTGTPGAGKTTLAKAIAEEFNLKYIDVNLLIKEHGLATGYDEERKCDIVDTDRLVEMLQKMDLDSCVIDSHLSHNMPADVCSVCLIAKCSQNELYLRLKKREYSEQKIKDNLEAEAFDICAIEAEEMGHRVIRVDTEKSIDFKNLKLYIRK